jgi:hypothetical protein
MSHDRLNVSNWIIRVLTWDTILPLILIAVPHTVHWLFPQAGKVIEVLGVLLPIVAFFVRLPIGLRHIADNHCPPWLRAIQQVALFLGIFGLVIVDAALILQIKVLEENGRFAMLIIFSVVTFCLYLPCMVLAMYPGYEPVPSTQIGNWKAEP